MSRPRPCGDGALWEIWAAGASHAGGSAPSGHSAAAVPAGDDGRGISVLCLFQPGPGGTGETTLNSPWGHWGPPFTTWGSVAGPRGTPRPGNISGPSQTRTVEPYIRPSGQREILGRGLRGGGPGRPPFWRTHLLHTPPALHAREATSSTHRVLVRLLETDAPCVTGERA